MSGIEIAGLIIGLFPLVVQSLELFQDACRIKGLLDHFRSEYEKNLQDIKDEELSFHLSLELLLQPLVEDDAFEEHGLDCLVADPGGVGWRTDDVAHALEERLGPIYERVMEIVNAIHVSIAQFFAKIIQDKPGLQRKLEQSLSSSVRNDQRCLFMY